MNSWKQRTIALLLALSMPLGLAGCKNRNQEDTDDIKIEKSSDELDKNETPEEIEIRREIEITDFLKKMAEVIPLYNFDELYFDSEEIQSIKEAASTYQTCDNQNTDYSELAKTIIKNSFPDEPTPLESNQNTTTDKDIMERNLQRALDIVFESPSNKNEDICLLKTLKISSATISPNSNALGHYDYETNTVYIDYEKCLNLLNDTKKRAHYLMNTDKTSDELVYSIDEFFTKLYANVLNLVREYICPCRKDKGQRNVTVAYEYSMTNLATIACENQVLYSDGFDEYSDADKFPNFQTFSREYEAYYLLLGAFNKKHTTGDYYKAIFDADLTSLYDFFGLKTDEDYETFYRIDEAINLLNYMSRSSKSLEEQTGIVTIGEYEETIGYSYKIDLFKMALKSLMTRLDEDDDYTKEEEMFLYQFVKAYIIKGTYSIEPVQNSRNETDLNRIYDEGFIKNVKELETIFYSYLCEKFDLDDADIDELKQTTYGTYFMLDRTNCDSNLDIQKLKNRFPLLEDIYERMYISSWDLKEFDKAAYYSVADEQEKTYIIKPAK